MSSPDVLIEARADLDGLPGGAGINIAHEAVDRHLARGRGSRTAIRRGNPFEAGATMNDEEILGVVRGALKRVAPEANLEPLPADADLRDHLDIDSMDFNTFMLALHAALKIEIAEKDYSKFFTLSGCVREIGARLRGR